MSHPSNTLSQRMGIVISENHVALAPESKRRMWDNGESWENYTLREICCATCGDPLFAVLSEDIFLADLIWPIRVVCEGDGVHRTFRRGDGENAGTVCKGRAINEIEAKAFLARYTK